MKKIFTTLLTGLLIGAISFFIGRNIGHADGLKTAEMNQKFRSIEEIKNELK